MTDIAPPAAPDQSEKPKLTPANENPWYCLMTLHGEQPEGATYSRFDQHLHARNRRDWNKWAARALNGMQRKALLEVKNSRGTPRFTEGELTPHSDTEWVKLNTIFRQRAKAGSITDLPDPTAPISLAKTECACPVILTGFLFSRDADLSGATFSGVVEFADTTFTRGANLSGATFSGYAILVGATFSFDAILSGATFTGTADLSGATFSSSAAFSGATFSGDADFSNVTFKQSISFENAKFKQYPPNFHESALHSDTNWLDVQWPLPPADRGDAATHVRHYQRLKQIMEGLKKHEDEHDFFAMEMRAQRVVDGGWTSPRGILNGLYGALSDYGRSIVQPLSALGFVIFACFVGLVAVEECLQGVCHTIEGGKAFALSLTSALGFLPLKKEIFSSLDGLSPAAHTFMAVNTVLSFIFLFLAGLGLRNRFRMK